jgi:uncharacterized membrane protein
MIGPVSEDRRATAAPARWQPEAHRMPLSLIPIGYAIVSIACSFAVPRVEHAFGGATMASVSAASAIAFFSAVSSGMMALTGIVFAIAFVMVQFGAVAYSPRLVVTFGSDPTLYHTLGISSATFIYSLAALVWTDRNNTGEVPLVSSVIVIVLLIVSLMAFARLIQRLSDLQINNVLQFIGKQGRGVIAALFERISESDAEARDGAEMRAPLAPLTQVLAYSGEPRTIARFDIDTLVRLAREAHAHIVLECAVGDTLVEDTVVFRVHGAAAPLPEALLMRAVHLAGSRTFEQDPKYAIRLLVDIAIRALSPAINDPTTAVQALDQIEDLLRRLGRRKLDAGRACDGDGVVRLTFPMPTWDDYLALSFDEIRQFGLTSVQVMRRMRAALIGLAESVATAERRDVVRQYLEHLNLGVGRSDFDDRDQATALQEDRQGLGLSRRHAEAGAARPADNIGVTPGGAGSASSLPTDPAAAAAPVEPG